MKKYLPSLIFVVTVLSIFLSNCVMRKTTCGDGVYYPYRRPDKVFPEFAKSYDNTVKVTFKILDSVEAVADVNLKNQVVPLRQQLTSNDALVRDMIKSEFVTYNQCICDPAVRQSHVEFQKYLAGMVVQLNATNMQLKTISDLKNTSDQELLLSILELTVTQTHSIIVGSPAAVDSLKKHFKLFITNASGTMEAGDLIMNGIMNALDTNRNAEFEYYYEKIDRRKADFEIIVSETEIVKDNVYEEKCDYAYTFTLLKIEGLTDSKGRGSEKINTTICEAAKRKQDVGSRFREVSFSMVQKMLK